MRAVAQAIEELESQPDDRRALGPYRLVKPLGKGGFAPVWLAKEVYGQTELRAVALKLFGFDVPEGTPSARATPSASNATAQRRAAILDEARALCRVEHPNVVRFYSIYEAPDARVLALVMEHVNGTSVDQAIEKGADGRRGIRVDDVLAVGAAVASALSAVHHAGLVHRDVKPANIIDAAGVYKLIDFGIAAEALRGRAERRRVVVDDLEIEAPAAPEPLIAGTLGYVDPVCARGAPATPMSDLYALGATLYECLTGLVPAAQAARAAGGAGLDEDTLSGRAPAPPLARVGAEVPAALARLVDALVDPEPARRPRSAEAVAWELERIRRERAGRERPLPPADVGPFRGLGRFEGGDRDVYFGRAIEVATALEMLRARGVLALIGPSGSGKSSLARAGVLPAVADGELGRWPKQWDVAIASPGTDPRAQLATALAPLVPAAAERGPEALCLALAERVEAQGRGVVLFIDQLEELVSCTGAESAAFLVGVLAHLGAQPLPGVRAIVAARRDLLDPLLAIPELGRVLTRGTLLVPPMSDATWAEVLDQALGTYGYHLEDEALREELLRELRGTASAMPLVQFALTELWARRDRATKTIPRAALRAIGGLAGALERYADAELAKLARAGKTGARAKDVLLAVTTPQGTRRAHAREELVRRAGGGDEARAAIAALEQARLLVHDQDGLTLAHETLLSQWTTMRQWIEAAKENRVLAERVEHAAAEWAETRDRDRLWKKRRLAVAEDLVRRGGAELSEGAKAFVHAARALERRGRVAAAVLVGLGLAAAAIGTAFYVRETTTREELANELRRQAVRALHESREKEDELRAETALLEQEKRRADLAQKSAEESAKDFADKADASAKRLDNLEVAIAKAHTDAERERLRQEVLTARKDLAKEVVAKPEAREGPGVLPMNPCGCAKGDIGCLMNCH